VASGSRRGAKAVREYKPQGIGSYRAVEHIGIGTCRGFINVGDLLAQGSGSRRGVDPIGDLLE